MATDKQRRTAEILVENRGKSVSGAMREAGYTDATAKNPKNLTESEGWQELMDQYLPDDMLLEALQADIKSNVGHRVPELTLAMKLKGRYVDKSEVGLRRLGDVLDELEDDIAGKAKEALGEPPKSG